MIFAADLKGPLIPGHLLMPRWPQGSSATPIWRDAAGRAVDPRTRLYARAADLPADLRAAIEHRSAVELPCQGWVWVSASELLGLVEKIEIMEHASG